MFSEQKEEHKRKSFSLKRPASLSLSYGLSLLTFVCVIFVFLLLFLFFVLGVFVVCFCLCLLIEPQPVKPGSSYLRKRWRGGCRGGRSRGKGLMAPKLSSVPTPEFRPNSEIVHTLKPQWMSTGKSTCKTCCYFLLSLPILHTFTFSNLYKGISLVWWFLIISNSYN